MTKSARSMKLNHEDLAHPIVGAAAIKGKNKRLQFLIIVDNKFKVSRFSCDKIEVTANLHWAGDKKAPTHEPNFQVSNFNIYFLDCEIAYKPIHKVEIDHSGYHTGSDDGIEPMSANPELPDTTAVDVKIDDHKTNHDVGDPRSGDNG